jgi:hypothetical protein
MLITAVKGLPYLELSSRASAEGKTLIYGLLGITGWARSRHSAASEFIYYQRREGEVFTDVKGTVSSLIELCLFLLSSSQWRW